MSFTLTASELIEQLQKLPPNKPVNLEIPWQIRGSVDCFTRDIIRIDPGNGSRTASIVATED